MSDSSWTPRSRLPEDFHATSTLALSPTAALFAGYFQSRATWIEDRDAAIFRWENTEPQRVYGGAGWVECASAVGQTVWAIAAVLRPDHNGSFYRALVSSDGGRSFGERGAVPVQSLSAMVAVSANEAWVLGAYTLARTNDGGRSWQDVRAPGTRDPIREKLALVGGRLVLIGDGALSTSDGGKTWDRVVGNGVKLGAIDRLTIAGAFGSNTRIGFMDAAGPRWTASVDMKGAIPFRIVADGQHLRIAAEFADSRAERGIVVYESKDGGQTWKSTWLTGVTTPGAIGFGPSGSGFATDIHRRVLHRPPEGAKTSVER